MKKASRILSAAMALTLGLSIVSYGAAKTEQAVAEPIAQSYAAKSNESEPGGYLFVTFVGEYQSRDQEQIYFALSRDGKNWQKVNGAQPVLKSTLGEQGLRDPNILRKPDGSGFYIVATDLSIYRRSQNEIGEGDAWNDCQERGSQQLVIFESNDLVNWSEPWLTPAITVENAGCAWAPEAFWDEVRQQYMVFWSSRVNGRQRVYRSFTKDFHEFTPAELYMDEGGRPWIDATIIEDKGTFYRFTKHEGASKIYMERSKSLDGPFEFVDTYTLDGQPCYDCNIGYEGPTCFKLNDKDEWCLLLDNFGGLGYVPYFTDDLDEGKFVRATDHSEDGVFRHGSVLPITNKEYDAICDKWLPGEGDETGELVYSLDFTADSFTENVVGGKATPHGTVTYEAREEGKYAAVISGNNNYIEIDGAGLINGLDSMTVSFMVNVTDVAKNWLFYTTPDKNHFLNWSADNTCQYLGIAYRIDDRSGLRVQRRNSTAKDGSAPTADYESFAGGEWAHVSVVYRLLGMELYVNGQLVSKVSSQHNLKDILGDTPTIQLGKANWGGGEYANYKIGDFKIYNYARSASEVLAEYNAVK